MAFVAYTPRFIFKISRNDYVAKDGTSVLGTLLLQKAD
jgi:hypothetical protein